MQPISLNDVCEQILAAATINKMDLYQREPAIARVAEVLKQPEITQALQAQYNFTLSADSASDLTEFAVFLANTDLGESEKQLILHYVLVGGLGQLKQMTLEKFYDFLQACPCFCQVLHTAILQGEFAVARLLLQTCGIGAGEIKTQAAILTKLNIWGLLELLLISYKNHTFRALDNYKLLLQYLITLLNQCQLVDTQHQKSFEQATTILQDGRAYGLLSHYNLSYNIGAISNYEHEVILALLDGDAQSICVAAKMAVLLNRLNDEIKQQLAISLARLAQTQDYDVAQQTAASITKITQLSLVDLLKQLHIKKYYGGNLYLTKLTELKNIGTLYEMLTPAQIQDLEQQQHLTPVMIYNIVTSLLHHGEHDLAERLLNKFNLNHQVLAEQYLPECIVMCVTAGNSKRAHQIATKFNAPLLLILAQAVTKHANEVINNIALRHNAHNDPLISMKNFYSYSYANLADKYTNYFTASLADNNQEQIKLTNNQIRLTLAKAVFMFIAMKRADLANLVLLKFNLNLDDLLTVALQQNQRTDEQQKTLLATTVLILIKAGYINSAQKILQNPTNNLTASAILSAILVAAGRSMLSIFNKSGTQNYYTSMQAPEAETLLQVLSDLLSLITGQDAKIALTPEYTSGILTLTKFCQKHGRLGLIAKILSFFDDASYQDENLAKIHEIIAPFIMYQDHKTKAATNTEQRQQLIMRDTHNSGHKMLTNALMQQFNQILAAFLSGVEVKPAQPLVRPTQLVKAAAPAAAAFTSAPKITFAQVQQMIIMGFKQLTNNAVANRVTLSREQELLLNKFIAYHNNTHANFVAGPAALEQIDTTKHQMIILDNHEKFGNNGKSMLIVERQVNGTHRVVYFNTNGLAMSEDLKQLLKQKLGNDCVFVAASCPLQPNNLPNQDAAYKK